MMKYIWFSSILNFSYLKKKKKKKRVVASYHFWSIKGITNGWDKTFFFFFGVSMN
jgi:hypothetical protein